MTGTGTEILHVARRLLREEGYESLTTQAIADRMDITDAGVHYHFETKEDLLVSLVERETEKLGEELASYEGPPEERLPALLGDRFEAVELLQESSMPPPSYQLLSATRSDEDSLRSALDSYMESYVAILTETIENGIETGAFETESPEMTARTLTAMVEGAEAWAGLGESPDAIVSGTRRYILSELYVEEVPAIVPTDRQPKSQPSQ